MSDRFQPEIIEEQRPNDGVPLWHHPGWAERFPWLAQATSGSGISEDPFDLGLAGREPVGNVLSRWRRLRESLGFGSAVHSLQIHGTSLRYHSAPPPPGLCIMAGFDGHITRQPDILLSISIADCVPVSLVGGESRAIALVHAGWRGTAGGILEDAVSKMKRLGTPTDDLWMHCGPAICGACYEVGPEVHSAINPDVDTPPSPKPIDLRDALAGRAWKLGIRPERITISSHCTLCSQNDFFSHRAGSPGRQMGVLGLRPAMVPEA